MCAEGLSFPFLSLTRHNGRHCGARSRGKSQSLIAIHVPIAHLLYLCPIWPISWPVCSNSDGESIKWTGWRRVTLPCVNMAHSFYSCPYRRLPRLPLFNKTNSCLLVVPCSSGSARLLIGALIVKDSLTLWAESVIGGHCCPNGASQVLARPLSFHPNR